MQKQGNKSHFLFGRSSDSGSFSIRSRTTQRLCSELATESRLHSKLAQVQTVTRSDIHVSGSDLEYSKPDCVFNRGKTERHKTDGKRAVTSQVPNSQKEHAILGKDCLRLDRCTSGKTAQTAVTGCLTEGVQAPPRPVQGHQGQRLSVYKAWVSQSGIFGYDIKNAQYDY